MKIEKGSLKIGDELDLKLNVNERELTKRNHSATHLLQAALEKVLGDHIKQMGSFVSSEYMRFDFTHYEKITPAQLRAIEEEVNRLIALAIPSDIKVMKIEEANKLGAKAFFSEKYGDEVRVVAFGKESIEFCGGCHVKNTSDIGIFVIESEASIASGVRRIQGRSSIGGYHLLKDREDILNSLCEQIGAKSILEAKERATTLLNKVSDLEKELTSLSDKISHASAQNAASEFIDLKGYKVLTKYFENASMDNINSIGDDLKTKYPDYALMLAGGKDGEIPVAIFVGGKALEANKAGDLVKEVTKLLQGGGGGRPNMANGKGRSFANLDNAFAKFKELLK